MIWEKIILLLQNFRATYKIHFHETINQRALHSKIFECSSCLQSCPQATLKNLVDFLSSKTPEHNFFF